MIAARSRPGAVVAAVALSAGAAACARAGAGESSAPVAIVPDRAATAGDRLLGYLPPGAEVVVEVDLARLRANPVVGAAVTELVAGPADGDGDGDADGDGDGDGDASPDGDGAAGGIATVGAGGWPDAPLADATAVVLAAYRVGTPTATTVTVIAGGAPPRDGLALADGVWALAPEGETAALLGAAGGGGSLADDAELLAMRAWAMPAAADGASLRVVARLDDHARRVMADALGARGAPATVSVWGDVADDLAVVARLADPPGAGRPGWLADLTRLRERAAAALPVRAIGLSRAVADTAISRDADGVRVALVVAPGRLARAVERWRAGAGRAAAGGAP